MAVTVANSRIMFTADNDTYTPTVNEPICSFTVTGAAANKFYEIRQKDGSGAVLFKYTAGGTPDNNYTEWAKASTSGGLFFNTDDAGTAFRVFVNIG